MLRIASVVAAIFAFTTACFAGQFEGTVEFTEPGCEKKGLCVLKSKFGFVNSTGRGWEAKAGNKTDGASIPPKLQGWFGSPFDADLIRAAIIHDHYCDRHVHSWSDTHWVFFDALMSSGVDKDRAELMWAGILLGGPKWIWLIKGERCSTGLKCIQQVTASVPTGGEVVQREGKSLIYRKPRYDDPAFKREMEAIQKLIRAHRGPLGRAEMETLVKKVRPADPFIAGPQIISATAGVGVDR